MAEEVRQLTELLGRRPPNPVWVMDGLPDIRADLRRHPELLVLFVQCWQGNTPAVCYLIFYLVCIHVLAPKGIYVYNYTLLKASVFQTIDCE